MALGVVAVALAAHFSGQLLVHRTSAGTAGTDLAMAELSSCMEDVLAQGVEGKLLGFPSRRFWPDPNMADEDWAGAAEYGPRWLIPAYSFGLRARRVGRDLQEPPDERQEVFKTRMAALKEQRMYVLYPGLLPGERALVPGPDPSFVPPDGLEVLLMVEWIDESSTRRPSEWSEEGLPTEAFDLAGDPCDPLELRGGDVRRRVLGTFQTTL